MHRTRLLAIFGIVVGVVGLFLTSLNTDGEATLPALNQANPDFPDGIPTIWGGLDGWAQIALVALIVIVLALALRPVVQESMHRTSGVILIVIGIALFAYAVVKWIDASDKADTLQEAFAGAAGAGAIPVAFEVSTAPLGYVLLLAGTAVVAVAGLLAVRGADKG
jgi:uncharacterized membrane protein